MAYFTTGFMAVMGLLFFLPALGVLLFKLFRRMGWQRAEGKVLRIERNSDPDTGSMMIQPVIEFWSRDGERFEVRGNSGYGLRYLPKPGQTVKIYFQAGSRSPKFELASRGLWQVSGILMLTGLLLMLPAILQIFVF